MWYCWSFWIQQANSQWSSGVHILFNILKQVLEHSRKNQLMALAKKFYQAEIKKWNDDSTIKLYVNLQDDKHNTEGVKS